MTVKELIAALSTQNPEAPVQLAVGWSGDTAYTDHDDSPMVVVNGNMVLIEGWMSNCGTTLEIGEPEEEEDDL